MPKTSQAAELSPVQNKAVGVSSAGGRKDQVSAEPRVRGQESDLLPDVVAVPEADGLDTYAANFHQIIVQVESSPSPEV